MWGYESHDTRAYSCKDAVQFITRENCTFWFQINGAVFIQYCIHTCAVYMHVLYTYMCWIHTCGAYIHTCAVYMHVLYTYMWCIHTCGVHTCGVYIHTCAVYIHTCAVYIHVVYIHVLYTYMWCIHIHTYVLIQCTIVTDLVFPEPFNINHRRVLGCPVGASCCHSLFFRLSLSL